MKRYSTSLIIREMQIKTKMRFNSHLSEWLSSTNKLARMWRKGTLVHCSWECRLGQPLWKTVWSFLQKLEMKLAYDPVIPLLGIIYPKKPKTLIQKNICTPMFIAALFTTAKIRKEPKCLLVDEWIKKMWSTDTTEYYSAIKKNEFLPFATI